MEIISQRGKNIQESATLKMAQMARALKEQGKKIIDLSLGEPDFSPPDFVINASIEAAKLKLNKYSPVSGTKEVRESICFKLKRDNDLIYTPEQIVVSTGAKQAVMNTFLSLINEGDEVAIFTPYWVSYRDMVEFCGGKVKEIPSTLETNFKIDIKKLENYLTKQTKALVFSNPCNPTGTVYTENELREIGEVLKKFPNLIIISDEIYEYLNFEFKHFSLAQIPALKERIVLINGLSKSFAVTGWRIGYSCSSLELAKTISKIQGQFTSGTSCISQYVAQKVLRNDPSEIQFMVDAFKNRRNLMAQLLGSIKNLKVNKPNGAFYFFIDIGHFLGKKLKSQNEEVKTAEQFSLKLLNYFNVATTSGESFGAPTCIRLSYACSEQDLQTACQQLKLMCEDFA